MSVKINFQITKVQAYNLVQGYKSKETLPKEIIERLVTPQWLERHKLDIHLAVENMLHNRRVAQLLIV